MARLLLTMLWANSADDKLMIVFYFFLEMGSDTLCKKDNLHEMSNSIF